MLKHPVHFSTNKIVISCYECGLLHTVKDELVITVCLLCYGLSNIVIFRVPTRYILKCFKTGSIHSATLLYHMFTAQLIHKSSHTLDIVSVCWLLSHTLMHIGALDTLARAHTQTHIHTHTNKYSTHIQTHIYSTNIHIHIQTHIQNHTHTRAYVFTLDTHTHIYTLHTHIYTHARARTHTYTHINYTYR